jgi:hypothetical protein
MSKPTVRRSTWPEKADEQIQRDQVCGRGECREHDVANFDYSNIFKTVAP